MAKKRGRVENALMVRIDQLQKALAEFVDAIDATGGIKVDPKGYRVPCGDEDWIDLGEAYVVACKALGREPTVAEDECDEGVRG